MKTADSMAPQELGVFPEAPRWEKEKAEDWCLQENIFHTLGLRSCQDILQERLELKK